MRVLIDESLPVGLAAELTGVDVSTVRAQHWLGLRMAYCSVPLPMQGSTFF